MLLLSHCSSDRVLSAGRCFPADWILSGVASPTCDPWSSNTTIVTSITTCRFRTKSRSWWLQWWLTSCSVSSMVCEWLLWSSGLLATSSSSMIRLRVSSCVTNECWRNKWQLWVWRPPETVLVKGRSDHHYHEDRPTPVLLTLFLSQKQTNDNINIQADGHHLLLTNAKYEYRGEENSQFSCLSRNRTSGEFPWSNDSSDRDKIQWVRTAACLSMVTLTFTEKKKE